MRYAILLMLISGLAPSDAQTWTRKRTKFPVGGYATGVYSPVNLNPSGLDPQTGIAYVPDEQGIAIYLADAGGSGAEWGNSMFLYRPEQDDGTSTTGTGTGWALMWTSGNAQKNNNSGASGTQFTSIGCSSGVVTITVVNNSAQFVSDGTNPDGRAATWISMKNLPAGWANGMHQITAVSGVKGTAHWTDTRLFTVFSYYDAGCPSGTLTGSALATVIEATIDELPNMPQRRHMEGMTYDSDAHTIRVCCGIADNSLDVNILNSTHSGTIGMHHMSKTANGGTNWEWTQDCGFGADYVGVTDPSLLNPVPGPGHLCGQEFLTPTTTNIGVNGLWCLDYGNGYGGGISSRGGTNCGFRMVFGGYDPTYQAWVLFGGSNGNALGCETILYYAATDTWRSLTNGAVPVGCGTTYPSARWNPAASRMVSLGNGKLLLFGGGGNGSSALNDTWIFQSCPSINIAACGWTKVNSTVNPAADNGAYNGVLDWVSSLGMVVYLDAQSPAHWWTFDPSGWQWADQGTGACDPVAGCPTFPHRTDGVNFYYHVGAYDAYTDQLVVFATCATTTTPTCATTQNPIWVLGFGNSALRLRKAL